jgi:DNA (cytosine-5)-methyltransferase 1
MKLIDLFCGAGGFSLGAHLAGFSTVLAVDKDPILTSAFTRNFPATKLLIADLSSTSGEKLLSAAGLTPGEDIGVIGGPPCQGFSLMGKRSISDSRNELLQHYFRLVAEIRPKFFIMENVPGLLLGDVRRLLDDSVGRVAGYGILGPVKVNANDYGAATNRDRVIIVGLRDTAAIPESALQKRVQATRATVADAIRDLPNPRKSGTGLYRKVKKLSPYAASARAQHGTLGGESIRALIAAGRVTGVYPTQHKASVIRRFSAVTPGKSDSISRCPRLSWNSPAPTLRAGTGPDHGSFQSVRPLHPEQPRVITVREAARLQGFPDWFDFHETKWHSFRMIGNSVSPIMAQAMLDLVADHLETSSTGYGGSAGNSDESRSSRVAFHPIRA